MHTLRGFYLVQRRRLLTQKLRNKGCVKPFQQGRLDLDNILISYYDTPRTSSFRQQMLRVLPVKFILLVMSGCHVSPLTGHSHGQIILFRILARFWWPIINKEVARFIRACAHCQLVNLFSREAQQLLQTVELDTPFEVVFIDFWETWDIPYWDGSHKILTCLYCMTGLGIGASIGLKGITSDQAAK